MKDPWLPVGLLALAIGALTTWMILTIACSHHVPSARVVYENPATGVTCLKIEDAISCTRVKE